MTQRALFLGVLVAWSLSPALEAAEPVGQARNLFGTVSVKRKDAGDFQIVVVVAGDSSTVFNYDTWKTGEDSTCEVFLDNGSIFVLKPLSVVMIKIDKVKKTVSVKLEAGQIKVITINSPDFLTSVLSPSGFVTSRGGEFIDRVQSQGQLHVESGTGQLSVTHNYGTTLDLGDGQSVDLSTNFDDPRRIFTVSVPQDNPGAITAHIVDHVDLKLPPGSTATVENSLVPGQGGTITVQSATGNLNELTITIGRDADSQITHTAGPGEKITFRFETDPRIEITPGDQTPRTIYQPAADNPLDNVNDILPPPPPPAFIIIIPDIVVAGTTIPIVVVVVVQEPQGSPGN